MPAVKGDIPNLVSGISQQAAALRLPTQAEEQVNFYSTTVEGLRQRPPTEHIVKLIDSLPSDAFYHIFDRDTDERYVVVIYGGTVKVYDFDGNLKTVTAPDGWGYITSVSSYKEDLRALSVADYTFIVNRNVTVTASSTTSAARVTEALIHVMAGNYGRVYRITINGSLAAEYDTPNGNLASHSNWIDTSAIAGFLVNGSVGSGPPAEESGPNVPAITGTLTNSGFTASNGWDVQLHHNAIYIKRFDGSAFSVGVTDGFGGNAMKVFINEVQNFADLPVYGPEGLVMEVTGASSSIFDNYWVRLDKNNTNDGVGVWRETLAPGTSIGLNDATMPHILVKQPDGSFMFQQAEWDQRDVGSETRNPHPSFVGRKIEDVFFHRNRLGFLTDENTVLSRAGSFFDFYRPTMTTVLDDDPIDVGATHVKVSLLKHAVPYQGELIAFSKNTPFRLSGNELLTPKTSTLKPLNEYPCSEVCQPIGLGDFIYFASDSEEDNEWAQAREFRFDSRTEQATAPSITDHVPAYIPAGVRQLSGNPDENVMVLSTDGAPDRLYVYRYYWAEDRKALSSWSHWEFPGAVVKAHKFIGTDLYVVFARDSKVWLEKLRMGSAIADPGLTFRVHLDRRVSSDDLSPGTYSAATNRTTYTLPYAPSVSLKAVTAAGLPVPIGSIAGTTVTLKGDLSANTVYFGYTYEARYVFSRFYPRSGGANGSTVTAQNGRLQVQHLTIDYDRTAHFKVTVEPVKREARVYSFTSNMVGETEPDTIPLKTGRFTVPVMSKSDGVTITLSTDSYLPCAFTAAQWRGNWNDKTLER